MAQHEQFGLGQPRADVPLIRRYTGTPGAGGVWVDINTPAAPLPGQVIYWKGPQALGTPPQARSGLDEWHKNATS